ncbi:MAG: energy-coupling factor transporter ATPase [Ruminococcaceae bacterium]|nr:energy-coupling factor transporter ATPase [Oscillospiraceae bacterium]
MELIKFENVSFSYFVEDENNASKQKEVAVLKDFNLTIEQGSFTAILGHNGSGKSTIAKLTNGILFPLGGSVTVCGLETKPDDSIYEVRRNVGMVFQNPDNQIVSSIVEEDVAFGVENLGIPSDECRRRVDDALKTVGMYEYREKSPNRLSGGQKQRVAVAGIIAMKPKCIVLDEPTAMLDPSGRKEVIDTVLKLNREEGITILLITHNMDEAVRADRVVVVDDGVIRLDGTPREVFSDINAVESLQLDAPQSTKLMSELGITADKTVLNSEECAKELYKILTA